MDKDTYYIKLNELIDKSQTLKNEINISTDAEKSLYLKLALNAVYEEMRILMEGQQTK